MNAPERIWARQTSGWGGLERGEWQNHGGAGGVEYIRADLVPTPGWRDIASAPKVKPLVWHDIDFNHIGATCPNTKYGYEARQNVRGEVRVRFQFQEWRDFDGDLDAFKAAAQADYTARILAALAAPGEPQ